jgi:hypothetical protein
MAANRKQEERDQLNSKCPRFQGNPGTVPRVPAGLARELNRIAGRVDDPFDVIVGESSITSIGPAAMECGCVHL